MNPSTTAYLILFLEGLASSGLQVTAIRQTTPFVGSSVLSTSIIISTFLAALAWGYYRGGKVPEAEYRDRLTRNLFAAMVIFGIGLSYPFVGTFFAASDHLLGSIPIVQHPLIHLGLYCLIIMVPLVFFLGQTVPLLLHTTRGLSNSEAAGNYTALSTIGNVVGCLITTLLLMFFFGVGISIVVNCLLLGICGLMATVNQNPSRRNAIANCASGLISMGLISFLNIVAVSTLLDADTIYGNMRVVDREDGRKLVINHSNASYLQDGTNNGWPYIETIKSALQAKGVAGKDVLVLGAGGFTLTADNELAGNFTYVDIDPAMKPLAEETFLGAPVRGDFVAEDARRFLLTRERLWDFIVVDVYSDSSTIPAHTATKEFFDLVKDRLSGGGTAMINIVASPTLEDRYSKNIDRTVRAAFPFCITDISQFGRDLANIVYFCRNKSSSSEVAGIYRDDTTKVEVEGFVAARQSVSH